MKMLTSAAKVVVVPESQHGDICLRLHRPQQQQPATHCHNQDLCGQLLIERVNMSSWARVSSWAHLTTWNCWKKNQLIGSFMLTISTSSVLRGEAPRLFPALVNMISVTSLRRKLKLLQYPSYEHCWRTNLPSFAPMNSVKPYLPFWGVRLRWSW